MNKQAGAARQNPLALKAAEWMLELQGREVSDERLAAWQLWLAEDVRHQQAFDQLQAVQECIDGIHHLPWPTDEEVETDRSASHSFVNRSAFAAGVASSFRRFSIAAAAALAIGFSAFLYVKRDAWLTDAQTTVIETSVGELRRIPLTDGSMLTADGRSRIAVQFDDAARVIELKEGEAFFQVAKDPVRPFVVHAGDATITAIGTSFNVRRSGNHVTVAVAEGAVETTTSIGRSRLSAGQQARFGADPSPQPVPMAPEAVAAWRDGQRQYRGELLADVVADLARYSTRRIAIQDENVGRLTITGTVFEGDIDKWLVSLESALPVQVYTAEDGVTRIKSLNSQ